MNIIRTFNLDLESAQIMDKMPKGQASSMIRALIKRRKTTIEDVMKAEALVESWRWTAYRVQHNPGMTIDQAWDHVKAIQELVNEGHLVFDSRQDEWRMMVEDSVDQEVEEE